MWDRRTTVAGAIAAALTPASLSASARAIMVRSTRQEDIPAMVAMLERRRLVYQSYQPVFWRKAKDSAPGSLSYFSALLASGKIVMLTATEGEKVVGFVIVQETPAPPPVDPGGMTVTLDDYCVESEDRWPDVGLALLNAVKAVGREKGWRQMVVVSAEADRLKSAFLKSADLTIASTWWTTTIS